MKTLTEAILERIARAGGRPDTFHLVADILATAARYMDSWTKRADDAIRIPDVLYETSDSIRKLSGDKVEYADRPGKGPTPTRADD